jgi:hypothetical protein
MQKNQLLIALLVAICHFSNGFRIFSNGVNRVSRVLYPKNLMTMSVIQGKTASGKLGFTPAFSSSFKDLKYKSVSKEWQLFISDQNLTIINIKVISFGKGHEKDENFKSDDEMKTILGGKGANLRKMSNIGLSVPPGFTITTEVCSAFQVAGKSISAEVWESVLISLKQLEKDTGRAFGDASNPLLVSVRSGAAISMPGMLDTILNLGLNDDTVKGLSLKFGERFALVS